MFASNKGNHPDGNTDIADHTSQDHRANNAMANSCMEWILRAFDQIEASERPDAPPRNRRSIVTSVSRACRTLFRIEKPPRFVVRPWPTAAPAVPRRQRSPGAAPATNALEHLRLTLKSLVQSDKEIQSSIKQLQSQDEQLGNQLSNVAPLALYQNDDFVTALAAREETSQTLVKAQAAQAAQRDKFRQFASRLCRGEDGHVLTPVFDGLLRPLLNSVDSASDARFKKEQLSRQLEVLRQLAERSNLLYMRSGKGWRVAPVKVASRIEALAGELRFLQQTEPSRERVMKQRLDLMVKNTTARDWTQWNKSAPALIAAEEYQAAVDELTFHRRRLDNDRDQYLKQVLKKDARRTQEEYDLTCLRDLLRATSNVKICENLVRCKRMAAVAAGGDLICLGSVIPDYMTEIGHGEGFSEDGRVCSEAPEELLIDDAHFQLRLDGILKWQAGLNEADDSAGISAPPSSALSDTSMYFQQRPWDHSAWDLSENIHDRRLMPWDSVTYREHRSGIKRKIRSERLRQEDARSALGVRSSDFAPPERGNGDDRGGIFARSLSRSSDERDPRRDIDLEN